MLLLDHALPHRRGPLFCVLRCVAVSLVLRSAVTLECGGSASMVADRSISLPVRASAACFVSFWGFCSSRVACGLASESAVSGWWCSLAHPLALISPFFGFDLPIGRSRNLLAMVEFLLFSLLGHVLVFLSRLLPSRLRPVLSLLAVRRVSFLPLRPRSKLHLCLLRLLCSAIAVRRPSLSCWLCWSPARCPRASCCRHPGSPASMLACSTLLGE
jgi:hypothetical protein